MYQVDKEFILEAHKVACSDWKQKLEKKFPEVFPKLEVGKWYNFSLNESPKDILCILFVEKIEGYKVYFSYGKDLENKTWLNKDWYDKNQFWQLATEQEVKESLVNEAKKRFGDNPKLECLKGSVNEPIDCNIDNWHYEYSNNTLYTKPYCEGGKLAFRDGVWAEPLKEEPKKIKEYVIKFKNSDEMVRGYHYLLYKGYKDDVYWNKSQLSNEGYSENPESCYIHVDDDVQIHNHSGSLKPITFKEFKKLIK